MSTATPAVSPPPAGRATPASLPPSRLHSLDAMRGFDMFWIIGGAELVRAIVSLLAVHFKYPAAIDLVELHTEHPEWNGYTAWDQIFPMFMFIAGVAMPYSLTARIERGDSKLQLYRRVIWRGLLLVLLGAIYNGLLRLDFAEARYPSVLGRIGLGYMFAGLIVLNTKPRGQLLWVIGILLGYYAAMKWIPVPEYGAGDWEKGHTLGDYLDRMLIPGKLYRGVRDPEGLFSTIPSIATVLSGALAGNWLRNGLASGHQKALGLVLAGFGCLFAGVIWSGWLVFDEGWIGWFPINKNLWTSSFVLFTSGWSLMVLAFFYWVIDVWGFKRWAFFFVVIGVNAITVYLVREFVDWDGLGAVVFGRAMGNVHPELVKGGRELALEWLMLYILYRQRIFLRV
ncbi:MAG: DUF5009 domain-containing protein [Planctomycetaceae bacterium]